jgi:hypothetical protein
MRCAFLGCGGKTIVAFDWNGRSFIRNTYPGMWKNNSALMSTAFGGGE